jgi:hypothetical protein
MFFGGDERIRTADLPRAKRSLCQLSYTPDIFTLGTAIVQTNQHYRLPMTINTFVSNIAYSPRMVKFFNHQTFLFGKLLKLKPYGGPKSIRTTDLSVISGML